MRPILPQLARTTTPAAAYAVRFIIALTVTLAAVLELLDTSIVNVAIPHMMGSLGATLDEIAWVSTGYVVANVIVLPISGWLSAQLGRRNYFALSIVVFIVSSIACGNAHSLEALIFWRIVQGLGGGGLLATAQSTIFEIFPKQEIGTAMAIFGLGIMVGPMLGPTVGGYLTEQYSWPWIFYINLPLGIIALILALIFVPDSEHQQKTTQIDYIGLLLLIAGVGSLQTLLERGEKLNWFDSNEIWFFAILSIFALIGFVIHELESDHPIVDLHILKDKQFSAGLVFAFFLGAALYSTVFVFPVYLQTLMGFNAWQTGLILLPSVAGSGVMMAVSGRLLQRGIPPAPLIITGAILFGWSMWGHSHFTTLSGYDDFFWPLLFRGVGLGLIFVPLNGLSLASITVRNMPNATGLYNLTRQLGGSVGIATCATLLVSLNNRERAELIRHVSIDNPLTTERLAGLTQHFIPLSINSAQASGRALRVLSQQVSAQAAMLSYEKLFLGFGVIILAALPLLLLMRNRPSNQTVSIDH